MKATTHAEGPRLVVVAVRCAAIGVAAQLVGYWGLPHVWLITTYWLLLLLAAATLMGIVARRPGEAVLACEAILTIASAQALWPVVAPPGWRLAPPAVAATVNGVSWSASFTAMDQLLRKEMPRPEGWEHSADPYLRVDLARDYKGPAGFRVELNGHDLGELSSRTLAPDLDPPATIPAWLVRISPQLLAERPTLLVVLRPTALDPLLAVAGHADPLVEPLRERNSAFFDGATWATDRLAGPRGGRAVGTYRIWVFA